MEEFIENLKLDEILEKLEDLERKIFFRSLNNKKHSSKSIYIFESIENRLVRLAYDIDSLFYIADYILAENGFRLKRVLAEIVDERYQFSFIGNDIQIALGDWVDRKLNRCMSKFKDLREDVNEKLDYFELPLDENIKIKNLIDENKNLKNVYIELIECIEDILNRVEGYGKILIKLDRFMNKNRINRTVLSSIREGLF